MLNSITSLAQEKRPSLEPLASVSHVPLRKVVEEEIEETAGALELKLELKKLHKFTLIPVRIKNAEVNEESSIEVKRINFLKRAIALVREYCEKDENMRKQLDQVESQYNKIVKGINQSLEELSIQLGKTLDRSREPAAIKKLSSHVFTIMARGINRLIGAQEAQEGSTMINYLRTSIRIYLNMCAIGVISLSEKLDVYINKAIIFPEERPRIIDWAQDLLPREYRNDFVRGLRFSEMLETTAKHVDIRREIDSSLSPYYWSNTHGKAILCAIKKLKDLEGSFVDLIESIQGAANEHAIALHKSVKERVIALQKDLEGEQAEIKSLVEVRERRIKSIILNLDLMGNSAFSAYICARFANALAYHPSYYSVGMRTITLAQEDGGDPRPISRADTSSALSTEKENISCPSVKILTILLQYIAQDSRDRFQGSTFSAKKVEEYFKSLDKELLDYIVTEIKSTKIRLARGSTNAHKLHEPKRRLIDIEKDLKTVRARTYFSDQMCETIIRNYLINQEEFLNTLKDSLDKQTSGLLKKRPKLNWEREKKEELEKYQEACKRIQKIDENLNLLALYLDVEQKQSFKDLSDRIEGVKAKLKTSTLSASFAEIEVGLGKSIIGLINELNRMLTVVDQHLLSLKDKSQNDRVQNLEGAILELTSKISACYLDLDTELKKAERILDSQDNSLNGSNQKNSREFVKIYNEEFDMILQDVKKLIFALKKQHHTTQLDKAEKVLRSTLEKQKMAEPEYHLSQIKVEKINDKAQTL